MLFHDTCTMHLCEILRYLRWSTGSETSYLSGREWINTKEKIDNLESAVWCKCTKYICHLSKEILFFPHFILYLCEIRHKKYRTTCCSWWEKFALFSLITLSFYEIIKWKQMFFKNPPEKSSGKVSETLINPWLNEQLKNHLSSYRYMVLIISGNV